MDGHGEHNIPNDHLCRILYIKITLDYVTLKHFYADEIMFSVERMICFARKLQRKLSNDKTELNS